jgi:hypothetical protein
MITGPQLVFEKALPEWQTQMLNVNRISVLDRHPVESHEVSALEYISDTESCHDLKGDLDNQYDMDNDWNAKNEFGIELETTVKEIKQQSSGRSGPL